MYGRIDSFTKEDLQKAVDNQKSVEEIASDFKCSISTIKRRAKTWGIKLFSRNGDVKEEVFIPYEDLVRSNDPDVRIEDICVKYGCSRKTLTAKKKLFDISNKTKKELTPISDEVYQDVYSGGNVEENIKNKGFSHGVFYRRLDASNLSTPHKKSLEAAKKIDLDEVKKMRRSGMSTREIANYYHVHPTTITRREAALKKQDPNN